MSFCFPRLHLFFLPPLSLTSLEERKTFKMASSQSLAALRAYVCAPGQAGGANQAESTVRLNVEHVALKATRFAELRLDKHVRVKTSSRWADRWFLPFFFTFFSRLCTALRPRGRCVLFFSVAERHEESVLEALV